MNEILIYLIVQDPLLCNKIEKLFIKFRYYIYYIILKFPDEELR